MRVAEIVEAVYRRTAGAVEPVAGVEGIVLHELEQRAVKLVAAALGDEQQLRAGIASVFGAEIIGNQLEFLDLFEIQEGSLLPADACIGNIGRSYIVDGDIIRPPAAAVGVVAAFAQQGIIGRHRRDSGSDEDELQGIPAHRQLGQRSAFHREVNLRVRVIERAGGVGHHHGLGHHSQLQPEGDVGGLAAAHVRLRARLAESRGLHFQIVVPDAELVEGEAAAGVGHLRARLSGFPLGEREPGLRHRSAGRIGDDAFDVARDLRRQDGGKKEKQGWKETSMLASCSNLIGNLLKKD